MKQSKKEVLVQKLQEETKKKKVIDAPHGAIEIIQEISALPDEERETILEAFSIKEHHHSGPLPDAESIQIYNEVIPNGGERLMQTVEKQSQHRIELEKVGLKRSFNQSSTGQYMGFVISIVFGLIAYDLAKDGAQLVPAILGGLDLVALVTVFITGNKNK